MFLDPSSVAEIMETLGTEHGHIVVSNQERYGVMRNVWHALDSAFSDDETFVLVAEDDVLVSDDLIEFMSWARDEYRDDVDVLGVVATQRWFNPRRLHNARTRADFAAPVWGTWQEKWWEVLRDGWPQKKLRGEEMGWDWWVRNKLMIQLGWKFVVPDYARCQHIGVLGAHMTEALFRDALCPSYRDHFDSGEWRRA